ncbi:MAG: beta-eliminating lyase-related protein [Rhodobacteraceae bacterium]|nr:beta-eliminating lyase-related protein [Paracoccaceae bacterium]
MNFASDNAGPAAPEIMDAVVRANHGYQSSYGADGVMQSVRNRIRERFEAPDAEIHLVATGTAANALCLACLCPPWGTVYCHRNSHVEEDECGAPEFYTGGAKLTLLEGAHARIDPAGLDAALRDAAPVGVHNVQKGALTLTNATENGAVYDTGQLRQLTELAAAHEIPVHVDGARFANAVAYLGCSPAELSWKAGVKALSLGGTKNGLLGVEAVVLFDPRHSWEFELRRKRGGHLFSKHRFLSAQMDAYLEGDLWLKLAGHANATARYLGEQISSCENTAILHPVEANMVFAEWPRRLHQAAYERGAGYYLWPHAQQLEGDPDKLLSARLVCNWSTTESEVDRFIEILRRN